MAVKKKKIILLVGILIIICGMFSGCGKGSPDENDAKSNVMYEYYCVKEPELVNSYEDEDMYVFEYNVTSTTPDNCLLIDVPVSVYYFYDSGEWIYDRISESGNKSISLNPDNLVGKWEGSTYAQTSSGLISDYKRAYITFEIVSVNGGTINYNLSVSEPDGIIEKMRYQSSGKFTVSYDDSNNDVIAIFCDEPLIVATDRNLLGFEEIKYTFALFSHTRDSEFSERMVLQASPDSLGAQSAELTKSE